MHVDVSVLQVVEHGAEHPALAIGIVKCRWTIELIVRSIRARVPDVDEREVDGIIDPEPRQLAWCDRLGW